MKPVKKTVKDESSSCTEARDHHNQELPLRQSNYHGN